MDTYEVGNFVRRWGHFADDQGAPADPKIAVCYVTDPVSRVSICTSAGGNVRQQAEGLFYWDMIARCAGEWGLRWSCADSLIAAPDQTDYFCVEEVMPDVPPKTFPCLSDGSDLVLKPLTSEYLELLRKWRNRDDIRRWFFNSVVISEAEQLKWYYSTYLPDQGDFMWIAHYEGKPVGTGALTHIDLDKHEGEWSRLIIGEDSARGKGLAGRIAALVRDYALDELKLERIYGSLYTDNHITMHIDVSAGYMPYETEGNITYVELLREDHR